jgi:hypothetical protein
MLARSSRIGEPRQRSEESNHSSQWTPGTAVDTRLGTLHMQVPKVRDG